MRVFVLGHRGMLGHVVARWLRENEIELAVSNLRFSSGVRDDLLNEIRSARPDWCINCIGIGPGRGATLQEMHCANVELPLACSNLISDGIQILHASSDGVFRPDIPNRGAAEPPDAADDYGAQKAGAERAVIASGAIAIRCSIIGPETGPPKSLLEWVLSRTGAIPGFVNQTWNGITTLEWAKLALALIRRERQPLSVDPVLQPGFVPPVTKFELVEAIAHEWKLPWPVVKAASKQPVSRWLRPNFEAPPLKKQLNELRQWY